MIVLEMKALVKPSQCSAIDEAIRTVQLIRNKALRLWMDAKREDKIDQYSLLIFSQASDCILDRILDSIASGFSASRIH
ncbi:hypothetical protein [Microcystis sp. M113S1]|jgi:hypothetical protein|uniref:hypothetical protein n=1 Tax=Microcystis sp. M113S1 TaxID=2771104 RepID=UPI0025909B4A|nr:hypothetical protein [Microcystis sp. M113S1]